MKLRTRVLAVLMSVLMMFTSPMQALAEGESANQAGDYLGEVYVAVAKTADEAAKALEDKGYAVLKGDDGRPADLNQGAGSALKEERAVVLGYKTTGERAKAITDLAVMNMSGGYSFSDYATLMDKYRDGQVRPFIERFMATVAEYRANAESQNPGNRARADMARTLLNRIVDDDTGGHLGDLLLERTRAEVGDAYDGLSEDEAKRHIDMETALMQGDSATVMEAERLLALAADSGERTWLERLSELGPDGLSARLGDMRPTDARAELDSRYQDLAKRLASGWEEVRARLLAQAPGDGSGGDGADAQDGAVELGGDDEEDLSALVEIDPPAAPGEASGGGASAEDLPQVLSDVGGSMEAMAESAGAVADTRDAAIAAYLSAKPYGDGTLYDLFTRPLAELAGDNIAALYPAASCLSEGQVAAMDFLTLTDLLQVGATTGDALAQVWTEGSGLARAAEGAPEVSLYEGVDRDIFSDKVALTSDALRADALRRPEDGVIDVLSTYRRSALLWFGTLVTGVVAGVSSYKEVRNAARIAEEAANMSETVENNYIMSKTAKKIENSVEYIKSLQQEKLVNPKIEAFRSIRAKHITNTNNWRINMQFRATEEYEQAYTAWKNRKFELKEDVHLFSHQPDRVKELRTQIAKLDKNIDQYIKDTTLVVDVNAYDNNLKLLDTKGADMYSLNDYTADLWRNNIKIIDQEIAEAPLGKQQKIREGVDELMGKFDDGWTTLSNVAGVAFFLLAVASVASTAYDVYSYYNVEYAPVPGYIVDASDITRTDGDGTTTVVRNDTAYYRAAATDAVREGKDLVAMSDYADLNGDAGKEWLALYTASRAGQAPILADSLRVVSGTSSPPDGYADGVHAFGSGSAANLTDARYCYNDDAGGVYVYFKREVPASATGSVFAGGSTALVGGLCLAAGAALGAGAMYLTGRRRREPAAI